MIRSLRRALDYFHLLHTVLFVSCLIWLWVQQISFTKAVEWPLTDIFTLFFYCEDDVSLSVSCSGVLIFVFFLDRRESSLACVKLVWFGKH